MKLPTIYKRTKKGHIQQWTIIVDGDSFHTEEGIVDGKISINKPTKCKAKNVGRANATTGEEQALKEAQAKWDRKVEKNYTTDIKKIDNVDMHYEPMLAEKFEKHKKKLEYPVITQRKSDGIRAIITKDKAMSRNGKEHKTVGHILEALQPFFKKYPDAILDGELYNHKLHDDFNKIASLIRKQKPTEADLAEARDMIEFHCYDAPKIGKPTLKEDAYFSERYSIMAQELDGVEHVEVVKNIMCNSEEEVKAQHDIFVQDGYEGIMIRFDSPYENKRTKNLLKYKIFETEEYVLTDIREGKGNKIGLAAHADCVMPDGKTFTANVKGPESWRRELLKRKDEVIGRDATIKFFNLTPDGIPRFPYLITIRDYE